MAWQYSGMNLKSAAELDRLARLQSHPLYNPKELTGFSHTRESKKLDKFLQLVDNPFKERYGWSEGSDEISLPKEKCRFPNEADVRKMRIDNIWYCDIINVITDAYKNDISTTFNMTPFTQY
jgi:hypothetical protein